MARLSNFLFYLLLIASGFVYQAALAQDGLCIAALSRHELKIQKAEERGLLYIQDFSGGYTRLVTESKDPEQKYKIQYFNQKGVRIKSDKTLRRLNALAVPPTYTEVWISGRPHAHIQAIGRDSNGKQQYFYHELWTDIAQVIKFDHMKKFGERLPQFRQTTADALKSKKFPQEKILALVSRLLEVVSIRVGNKASATQNESFGLTTMLKSHVVKTNPITLEFVGKGDVAHSKIIKDPGLAKITRELLRLEGDQLFQYVDSSGAVKPITSADVNAYIKMNIGEEFSAKDFRTWMATVYATEYLYEAPRPVGDAEMQTTLKAAAEYAASHLGNTPEVCRKSYIHPAIFEKYKMPSRFAAAFKPGSRSQSQYRSTMESAVLRLIK